MIEYKNIPYAAQSEAQKLDIYQPESAPGLFPVIVWLHPGGYTRGDKDMVKPFLPAILASGYAVASINYRLADEAKFPAQIFDAKAAVRWLRANSEKYNLNGGRVAVWGISAGSTFAALLGTSGGVKELEDLSLGNAGQSSRVAAVVDVIGPVDLSTLDSQLRQLGKKPFHDVGISGESKLIGGRLSHFPERCRAVNPKTYITLESAPFYIQHGTEDEVVPYLQAQDFAAALTSAIGKEKVVLELIPGATHFDPRHGSPEYLQKALRFLDKYLKPGEK